MSYGPLRRTPRISVHCWEFLNKDHFGIVGSILGPPCLWKPPYEPWSKLLIRGSMGGVHRICIKGRLGSIPVVLTMGHISECLDPKYLKESFRQFFEVLGCCVAFLGV